MNRVCSKTIRNADATGPGLTKQEAKQEAEKNINKKMSIRKDRKPNNIGDLQELLMQRKMTLPKYEYSIEGSPNGLVFYASCILESGYSELGFGKTRQQAKGQAAAKMLKRLNDSMVDTSMKIPTSKSAPEAKTFKKKKAEINPPKVVKHENESPKKIIERKVIGTVMWFNVKAGYGFINRNDTKEDVFIHQTAIDKNNPSKVRKSVGEGETLEFNVAMGKNGYEAINVTGLNGRQVEGSNFALDIKVTNKNKFITKKTKEKRNTMSCNSKNPSSTNVGGITVVKKEKSDLAYALECPICYELPQNPIYQCANGHLICNLCHSKVKKCPICVVNLDSAKPLRNLTAEYLVNDMLRMAI